MTTETETYKRVLAFVYLVIESEGVRFVECLAKECLPGFKDEDIEDVEIHRGPPLLKAEKITRALISGEKW